MSIGKNTRKPVAAARAMPRTIDNAKSDMEAPAYNDSVAIAELRLPINLKIAASEDKTLSARSYTIIAARFGDRGFHHDAKT